MPFKSEAQRRFLYAKHPDIAKRWSAEYPNQGALPDHVQGAKPKPKAPQKKRYSGFRKAIEGKDDDE